MSAHLSKDELTEIIQKSPQYLSTGRFLHYEKCHHCQNLYKQQLSVHGLMLDIKPIEAPTSILNKVLKRVELLPVKNKNGKTDWVFFFSLIILFGIGAYFLFSGSIGQNLAQYLPQILSENDSTNSTPGLINSFTNSIKTIQFPFDLFRVNGRGLYFMFGFISFIFYILLDKKYGHGIRLK